MITVTEVHPGAGHYHCILGLIGSPQCLVPGLSTLIISVFALPSSTLTIIVIPNMIITTRGAVVVLNRVFTLP